MRVESQYDLWVLVLFVIQKRHVLRRLFVMVRATVTDRHALWAKVLRRDFRSSRSDVMGRPTIRHRANGPWSPLIRCCIPLIVLVVITSVAFAEDVPESAHMLSDAYLKERGFQPLLNGDSLAGWDVKPWHVGHWTVQNGVINYDGRGEHKRFSENTLWTKRDFGDFELYVEWRLSAKPEMKPQPIVLYNGDFLRDNKGQRITRLRLDAGDSGILMRGILKCQANIWSQELGSGEVNGYRTDRKMSQEVRRACIPIRNADRPFGEWNYFLITLTGEQMTVVLNGQKVIDAVHLPDLPPKGPIGLQHHGDSVQFRRPFIRVKAK